MSRTETSGVERAIGITVAGVLRRYRAREDVAERIVRETLHANSPLTEALETGADFSKIERTRAFKEFQKAARKKVYYALRRYHDDDVEQTIGALEALVDDEGAAADALVHELAASHVSTRERLEHLDSFRAALADSLGDPRTILDVGSGLMPLLFDFERFPGIEKYQACDRDPTAVRALTAAARFRGGGRLQALSWELAQGFSPVLEAAKIGHFDVALLLQLVPVVQRREPEGVEILAQTPARRLIVTGARQSMTKRRDISGRERRSLLEFASEGNFIVRREFETPSEIGLVLERS